MFEKVNVPVLGIVENMAMHCCRQCGHVEHLFGEGGAQRMAEHYHVPLLGSLPLDIAIREHGDLGQPITVAAPEGSVGQAYAAVAACLAAEIGQASACCDSDDHNIGLSGAAICCVAENSNVCNRLTFWCVAEVRFTF